MRGDDGALASHSVSNPDMQSERRLLAQLAPDIDEDMIRRLVATFQDLRRGYDEGKLSYPYSLRGDASVLCLYRKILTRSSLFYIKN